MIRRPPRSTRTDTLFPYTTLFRSGNIVVHLAASEALKRFRVIDLTQVRAGPTACRQLADWGADVIQVQMPEHMRGDDTLGGQDGSDYQYTHRNKRSITLNLKEHEGIAALKRLIAKIGRETCRERECRDV